MFAENVSPATEPIIAANEAAGFVMVGKSNTPEFGLLGTTESLFLEPCHNPWNLEHSSGGSSGGAAAAVASGMVPLAHATDGGGSIRIPASCCGVFGLKPSRGRIFLGGDTLPATSAFSIASAARCATARRFFVTEMTGEDAGAPPARHGAGNQRLKIAFER